MYAWKCWRDTRTRFLTYLGLWVLLFVYIWDSFYDSPPLGSSEVEVIIFGALGGWLAGAALGSSGPGEEWDRGSIEFLLTRPRSRRHLFWTAWAVAMAELFVLAAVTVLGTATLWYLRTGNPNEWRIPLLGVPVFAFMVFAHGIACFTSALTRSGLKGLIASLGTGAACFLLSFTHRAFGTEANLLRVVSPFFTASNFSPIPIGRLLGWFGSAFALCIAAELFFNRADI